MLVNIIDKKDIIERVLAGGDISDLDPAFVKAIGVVGENNFNKVFNDYNKRMQSIVMSHDDGDNVGLFITTNSNIILGAEFPIPAKSSRRINMSATYDVLTETLKTITVMGMKEVKMEYDEFIKEINKSFKAGE